MALNRHRHSRTASAAPVEQLVLLSQRCNRLMPMRFTHTKRHQPAAESQVVEEPPVSVARIVPTQVLRSDVLDVEELLSDLPRQLDERGGSSRLAALLSARLLPARAKQLSAARRATRRSKSAAPPTVPASCAGWPRHWLRRMSGAAQAASLHASPLHPWNNYLFLNLSSYMELNTQGV